MTKLNFLSARTSTQYNILKPVPVPLSAQVHTLFINCIFQYLTFILTHKLMIRKSHIHKYVHLHNTYNLDLLSIITYISIQKNPQSRYHHCLEGDVQASTLAEEIYPYAGLLHTQDTRYVHNPCLPPITLRQGKRFKSLFSSDVTSSLLIHGSCPTSKYPELHSSPRCHLPR